MSARVRRALGSCGDDPGLAAGARVGPKVYGELDGGGAPSRRNGSCPTRPRHTPGSSTNLGVIVVLHGVQGFAAHAFEPNHGLDRFQAAAVALGLPPFVLAVADGGPTLWFDRPDGERPQSLIVEGLLPVIADLGLSTERVALYGWGSGGYGAILLLERLGIERVTAVASTSPALFSRWDEVDGYHADEAEYERLDAFDRIGLLEQVPYRVTCGDEDPFADEVERFRAAFPVAPVGGIEAGCRDQAYWHRAHPDMLAYLAPSLGPS